MTNEKQDTAHVLTRLLIAVLLSLPLLLSAAQTDSTYIFRFVRGRGMFYVPYLENGTELQRLLALIRQHREDILSGNIPVFVQGFCHSAGSETGNRQIVRERSNRVKTEMILKGGLREDCFWTTNYTGADHHAGASDRINVKADEPMKAEDRTRMGDRVEVWLALPRTGGVCTACLSAQEEERLRAVRNDKHGLSESRGKSSAYRESLPVSPVSQSDVSEYQDYRYAFTTSSSFSLHANLLRWATLTPDLGAEFRFSDARIGILLNGTYANWGWKHRERRYKVWRVSPEIRYYMGKDRRGFLGAMYHLGQFNYRLGYTGKAGDYQGGGVTGGYRLPLNRHLSLHFHAALGYTRAEYDRYTRMGAVNVRQNKHGKLVKNYWGVNQLGISLSYDFKL